MSNELSQILYKLNIYKANLRGFHDMLKYCAQIDAFNNKYKYNKNTHPERELLHKNIKEIS